MILPASYANGFAPRDGQALYPELWKGCVGAWNPGLGPTGLVLRDWSGRGNHGTLTNMDAATDWVKDGGRYALDFDGANNGANDAVLIGNPARLAPVSVLTFSYWVLFRGAGTSVYPFASWSSAGGCFGAQRNQAFYQISGGTQLSRTYSVTPSTGVWTHVAVCMKSQVPTINIYINGKLSNGTLSGSSTGNFNTFQPLAIGMLGTNTFGPLDGMVDDVWYYHRELSPKTHELLASRRGIAYELAPRRRSSSAVQFNRRRRLLIGASS